MVETLGKTILVVDDEPVVVKYLAMALEDAGFTVATASDGIEGLDKVKKLNPDLISMDLVMPKGSGAKMYRELQKDKELKKIPVIIVTGHAHDDLGKADLDELTMSGPGIYLEKPIKPHNYVAAIKMMLNMPFEDEIKDESQFEKLKDELGDLLDKADPKQVQEIIEKLKKDK